ncbi:MAG: ABC transporter permease [Chloroflexi bacterium RBG_13_51_36]|nr:MAG: ABC transporter permease [Chloroflexi bacterium RBG_13_51_36]
MTEIWDGLTKAVQLLISLDPAVMEVAGRSLTISATACLLASLICIPLGSLIHFHHFRGKRVLINIIQTLFSVPTVLVGLFLLVLLSRSGPLGELRLLFTPTAMVIGQMILITPLLLGLTISALSGVSKEIADTATSLGASGSQAIRLVLKEARYAVLAAVMLGFARAISEVGCALMVGGNIRGATRVITTVISLEAGKGNLELAIALGMILLLLALIINIVLNRLQQR